MNRKKILPLPLQKLTSKQNLNATLPCVSSPSSTDFNHTLKMLSQKLNEYIKLGSNRSSNTQRMQERFQRVLVDIPKLPFNKEQRKYIIQKWLGKLCSEVFSISFALFESDKLNQKKMKSFCSENMLLNILKMIRINNLTVQQIEHIDIVLKQDLLLYFQNKYPLSEQSQMNLQFSNKVVEIDSLGNNQNDLVYRSGVKFIYRQDGNYNRQIMKLLNYIIKTVNIGVVQQQSTDKDIYLDANKLQPDNTQKRQKKKDSLFKQFSTQMDIDFRKIEEQNYTIAMNNYDLNCQAKDLFSKKSINNILQEKTNNELDKLSLQQQKKRQAYRQNVKSYTKRLIGRKISQNVRLFTQNQINEGDLNLKDPALMRIVIKWCVQLMWNFNVKRNILNKEDQFRMKDGGEKILKRKNLKILAELLNREKKNVDQYLKKIKQNNNGCKFEFATQEWDKFYDKFTEQEVLVGLFSANSIRNYQSYLIGYVNTIIHALMTAIKDYEQITKAYQFKQKQYSVLIQNWLADPENIKFQSLVKKAIGYRLANAPASYISLIPQLVSFRVGDIMRCKCISKQKQIIALYTDLKRRSDDPNEKTIKIVRIRNRLEQGTKDILINILYKDTMVIQMQLAISTTGTKFIDYSIKFNHMLYQLRRSQFGAISQLCNIWINSDQKADFYLQRADLINTRKIKQNKQNHICDGAKNTMPFRCQVCSFFYNDCQYVKEHVRCKYCQRLVCSLCQAEKMKHSELKYEYDQIPEKQILNMQENQTYLQYKIKNIYNKNGNQSRQSYNQVFSNKQNCGIIIDLKGQDIRPKWCKVFIIGKRHIILCAKGKNITENTRVEVLKELCCMDDIQIFKKQYLIFESVRIQKQLQCINKEIFKAVLTSYYFPKQVQKWVKREKKSIGYVQNNLTDEQIKHIQNRFKLAAKVCFYGNQLTKFDQVMKKFPNVKIMDLGKNYFRSVKIIDQRNCLKPNIFSQIKVLFLNNNKIEKIDDNFAQKFPHLRQLELSGNILTSLPENFGNMHDLVFLNLSRNQLKSFPIQITKLINLEVLSIYCEQKNLHIKQLPDQIGNLQNLKKLNLNFNNIQKLPQSFGNLQKLQVLYIVDNSLKQLPASFQKLKKLKILNLSLNNFLQIPEVIGHLVLLEVLHLQLSCIQIEQQQHIQTLKRDSMRIPKKNINQIKPKKLPQSYCNLTKLKMLDISCNQITQLPQNFGNLKQLDTLLLYQNYIQKLPESIGKLQNLRLLYTSDNLLKKLPNSICNLKKLIKLTLEYNQDLIELPKQFYKLENLKCLFCKGSGLSYLPMGFEKLTELKQLDISNTQICILEPYLKDMQIHTLKLDQKTLAGLSHKSRQIYDQVNAKEKQDVEEHMRAQNNQ